MLALAWVLLALAVVGVVVGIITLAFVARAENRQRRAFVAILEHLKGK